MRISRILMRAVAGFALCILLPSVYARAEDGDKGSVPPIADLPAFLNTLGKKVSNFKTLKTDFTQEKEMALFTQKVVLKGRIYIQKPGKIAWHVDKPIRYSVLITDKLIRQWDEDTDRVQEISLSKNPIFQVVLNQLTVWFSGEYGSLLESHDVKVLKQDPLEMEFRPREKEISSKAVRSITITFRQDRAYLERIRIQELSGDVTTIHFTNTLLNAPLDSMSFEVHPVRKRSSLPSPDGEFMKLSLEHVIDRRHEPMQFSNGVK